MRMRESSLILKNMADYHKERTNTKGFRKGENEETNYCHKTTKDSREEINAGKRQRNAEERLWIETGNKFVDILFALNSCVFICTKARRSRIQSVHCSIPE